MAKRLNVLLITNLFPTPVDSYRGIFTYQLVKRLKETCDVTVICPLPWFPAIRALKFLDKWYPFSQVPSQYEVGGIAVASPKYVMIPKVSEALHSFFVFLGTFLTAARLHRERRFDVINAQWLYPDGVAASWIARILRLPTVLTGLGCDVNLDLTVAAKRGQILSALHQADSVTFVSEALRECVRAEGFPESKLSVIPNGVDLGLFRPRPRNECLEALGQPTQGKTIVFVGQILEVKGIDYLLEAAAELRKRRRDFTLYLVGESPDRRGFEQKSQSMGQTDFVKFVGGKTHGEIAVWMGASDVFCLSSVREGWPNVVMEALSSGRPVVASRVGGIPEIIDGSNGILVEPRQSQALCDALDAALNRSWDAEKIHASVARFSWEKAAETYGRIFEEAASAGKKRSEKKYD